MNAYLRCGAAAIALLAGVGLASAQTYPRGTPGSNDNVLVAPADRLSAESLNENTAAPAATPARKHKSKHAGTTHKHSKSSKS